MIRESLVTFLNSLGSEDLSFILGKVGATLPGEGRAEDSPGLDLLPRPGRKRICPTNTFEVPPDVKHLDLVQLHSLTEGFRSWFAQPTTPSRKRARGRIWLLYLIIRYGALKLGEALNIDDRYDFDFAKSLISVRSDGDREVQLPKDVSKEIRALLEDPINASLRGEVFRMDQGYVRRKFYERGDDCSVPRELASPRVIRHSRAVELLREGMPLSVVQSILGHQSINLTAQYVNFSETDIKRIVNYYILKEAQMKTSARNSFTGKVTAIRTGNILAEVEVTTPSGLKVVSVITQDSMTNLGIREGLLVTATVKAPWVILVKDDLSVKTSARNRYPGKITNVNIGQISAEVIVEIADGTKMCALVTDESVKQLDLKAGDEISVLFKAFSVILNAE